jgi:hypothetical protein
MKELVLLCGFDTLEYSWVKVTIGICMLVDYFVEMSTVATHRIIVFKFVAVELEKFKWKFEFE